MMTHDEMIAVIQYHKNGGAVEFKCKSDPPDQWLQIAEPGWNFYDCDYRPEPEPMVIYVTTLNDGSPCSAYTSEQSAADHVRRSITPLTIKKFIEVTE
jgi:hypothetical protein